MLGAVYGLLSFGLALIWGMMDVLNFAHGEFFTLGAYATYVAATYFGLDAVWAFPFAAIVPFLVAPIFYEVCIKPMWKQGIGFVVITTFSVSILLRNVFLGLFGPFSVSTPAIVSGPIEILGVRYSLVRLGLGVISIVIMMCFYVWFRRTRFGLAMQAIVQKKMGAQLMGININRVCMLGFGIGSALTGVAGILLTPVYFLNPNLGWGIAPKAFAIVVLAGFGSLSGIFPAGLILGLAESLGGLYLSPVYKPAYGFLILILVLVFFPKGLRGRR